MEFSEVLVRLRKAIGHKSAYDFFYKSMGKRGFGISYHQYVNIEKGRSIPRPKIAVKIAQMLALATRPEQMHPFMLSYLRALFGEETYDLVVSPFLKATLAGAALSAPQLAIQKSFDVRKCNLSHTQARLITQSPLHYWVFQIFSNDKSSWSAKSLSNLLKLPQGQIQSALDEFLKHKFIKLNKSNGYHNPHAGTIYSYPPTSDDPGAFSLDLKPPAFWQNPPQPDSFLMRYWIAFRASEMELRGYMPYLRLAVKGSETHSTVEKKPDSALFGVQVSVQKLLRF